MSVDFHGCLWTSTELYGRTWASMDAYVFPTIFMDVQGIAWNYGIDLAVGVCRIDPKCRAVEMMNRDRHTKA